MRRGVALIAAVALALGATWGVGFAAFDAAASHPGLPLTGADGIVALTGGAGRIETALRLLADGQAPLLLISGAGRGTDLAQLVPIDSNLTGRVTVGHAAMSTAGNATETAAWAHGHGIRRLIVVTAGYHMPRALLELQHALPGVQFQAVPAQSPALRGAPPATTVRMLANEYDKLLAVRLGVARLMGYGDAP